jgi:hypothetical protein
MASFRETELARTIPTAYQATLVRRGAFLQLVNESDSPCRTLYVVGPAYVFEPDETKPNGPPRYDDAIALDETWEELAELDWKPPSVPERGAAEELREAALRRIHERHRGGAE